MKNKLLNISKKSKMIAATAFVLGIVAIGRVTYTNTTLAAGEYNGIGSLVSAIAEKFNLNASEVEIVVNSVLESERSLRGEQGKLHQEDRLTQAVTDGKITQAQADLITAKMSEMKVEKKIIKKILKHG